MTESISQAPANRRDRSIRLAVITSFVSKGGSILLQLLSIPIAIRVLGREEFGLFTTVSLTLSTISMLEVGVGPALTHGLTRAHAAADEIKQRELGSTAFFLMLGMSLIVGLALAVVLWTVPLMTLYGESFAGQEASLRPALWAGLVLFLMYFVLNLTERIREGYLEVASNNLWGATGNVVAALAVAVGIWFIPQVWFLVVAIHGSIIFTKICNTLTLWKKHPFVRPSLKSFQVPTARNLFTDGIAFTTTMLITGIVEYNFCGWLIGREGGPSATALYGVFISLTGMQLGFVVMLSTPTWPAVSEALARKDLAWAQAAAKRLYLFGSLFAICSALGLVALGPFLLPLWLGKEFSSISPLLFGCYGLYFVAHVWRHMNHAMMIGTGQVGKMVRVQLFESALVAILGAVAFQSGGVEALFVTMGLLIFLLTGTFLPRLVFKALKNP